MGSLASNIGDKAVTRIGQSIGELMNVSHQFDSVNNLRDPSGRHHKRSVQLDMEKMLEQLNGVKLSMCLNILVAESIPNLRKFNQI